MRISDWSSDVCSSDLVGALTGFLVTGAQAETVLTVATAGSENMADYVTDYLGPKFEAANPGVSVRVIGTGPGDAGSNAVMERTEEQVKAGTEIGRANAVTTNTKEHLVIRTMLATRK